MSAFAFHLPVQLSVRCLNCFLLSVHVNLLASPQTLTWQIFHIIPLPCTPCPLHQHFQLPVLSDSCLEGPVTLVGSRGPLVPCADHEKEHFGKFQQSETMVQVTCERAEKPGVAMRCKGRLCWKPAPTPGLLVPHRPCRSHLRTEA